jgi:hypothetical protein
MRNKKEKMEVYKCTIGHFYILEDKYLKIIPIFKVNELTSIPNKKKFICIEFEKKQDKNKFTSKIKLENIVIKKKYTIIEEDTIKKINKTTIIEIPIVDDNNNVILVYSNDEKITNYLYFQYNINGFKRIDFILWEILTTFPRKYLNVKQITKILYLYYNFDIDDEEYKTGKFIFCEYVNKLHEMKNCHIIKMPVTNRKIECFANLVDRNIEYAMYNHIKDKWSIIDKDTYDRLYIFGKDLTASRINEA